ncbi:MAG: fec operon regulator FecR [Bacteroidetes bacterium]|jgi:transmembrane sensor|nr:fec operon regulator FecR [Bacteroidota bacterium]
MNSPNSRMVDDVLNGMGNEVEAEQLARWFATDEGQSYLSERIDKEYDMMNEDGLSDFHSIPSEKMYHSICKNISRTTLRRKIIRRTAILLPVAAFIALLFYFNTQVSLFGEEDYQDVYVAKGEQLQVAFQDGTRVYLYPNSHLRYPIKFGLTERKVYLEGEGYFVVTKNPKRPFVVDLGKASVCVTGTSFHVQAYASGQHILVGLDEGKVHLLCGEQRYLLHPGEDLVFDKKDNSCIIHRHQGESALTQWRNRQISFSNAPLKEVLAVLNLNYDAHFEVTDTVAYHYNYTFLVRKASLEEVLKTMEIISPVCFMRGDTVQVTVKHQ